MSLEFFEFSDNVKKEWNEFVLTSPYGSIHQLSEWKNFQEKIPGREQVLGFGVKKNGKIVATTFCVKMNTGFAEKKWFYSARGPVFDSKINLEIGEFLIQKVSEKLKTTKAIFWRIDPYFTPNWTTGLKIKTNNAIQNYQPENTLEIDLNQSDEEILQNMKRKGRYNVGLADKKNVKIVAIENGNFSSKDLDDFWKLNIETTNRDGFSGHEKTYYHNFLSELKNYAVLFFAEFEGKRIATAISTFCGDKAIYYFGASTSELEFRNIMAPYLLQFYMMKYAKEKGCKSYDFLGIAPENNPNHSYAGITEFKLKFGGNRKTYAQGREIVFSGFWYFWYKLIKKLKTK